MTAPSMSRCSASRKFARSEERRVGKECYQPCRSRGSPHDIKKNFLAEKEFSGVRGLVVSDEMAVAIAAQACLPALALATAISFFFFKQKTAYEMVGSDWSSDVCSSDLGLPDDQRQGEEADDDRDDPDG